ncbi:hypothetical protein IL306_006054 [Fusarium sp. DS 682]|nr:hypothetical protein IL306_006054 [Fusarium sp. DS 682]
MKSCTLISLAFGLVAASPCKPVVSGTSARPTTFPTSMTETSGLSTGPVPLTTESTTAETSSETGIETPASVDSTASEVSTLIDTTSAEFTDGTIPITETSSVATPDTAISSATATLTDATTFTSLETPTGPTTFTTALASSVENSAALTTTTTSEVAGPTDYLLIAGPGAAVGLALQSNQRTDFPLVFGTCSGYNPVLFTIDKSTGRLTQT